MERRFPGNFEALSRRPGRRNAQWLGLFVCAAQLLGCGSSLGVGAGPTSAERSFSVQLRALYEARVATPVGASLQLERRPIRRAAVLLRSRQGEVRARTETDELGNFAFEGVQAGDALVVVARADSQQSGGLSVTRDAMGLEAYELRVSPAALRGQDIVASDGGLGLAGAFHILDTLLRGKDAVQRWLGVELPELFAVWARDETETWSYYHGEVPEGGGRFGIELLSGQDGDQQTHDTDEHDESIVLHEYGHFVLDQLSTDSSIGGSHPPGTLVDPGLAFEEGRATWFSAVVLGQPWYLDTIGREPTGRLRVAHNLERGEGGPRGLGSEQEVAEILWDLSDGTDELEDEDRDGVALGPAWLLQRMVSMRAVPGLYPSLSTFLQYLRDSGGVPGSDLEELLRRGGYGAEMLSEEWPPVLSVGGQVTGKVDGVSQPAPSGGPNQPGNGVDAVRAFRIRIDGAARLRLRLQIFGSGRVLDRQDLDLELRNERADLVARAATEAAVEVLELALEPGWYVVYVRDGGAGNQVGFELDAALLP